MHLFQSRLLDDLRVVGTSLDDLGPDEFRALADAAIREHLARDHRQGLSRVPPVARLRAPVGRPAGPARRGHPVRGALPGDNGCACTTSVLPKAALSAVKTIADADLVDRSRIIMEKPFGTDYVTSVAQRPLHGSSMRTRSSGSTTSWARRPPRTSLAFRFANGLFERSGTEQHLPRRDRRPWRRSGWLSAPTSTRAPVPIATWS